MERITESPSLYDHLESKSVREIIEEINAEDRKVAVAVQRVLPEIERLIEAILPGMSAGGRLFYIGAGTSGRLGVLDASEIPPTFGMPASVFVGLIAGGDRALRHPVEHAEDSTERIREELQKYHLTPRDSLIGIAASGTTPYVVSGIEYARGLGLVTGGITSNPHSPVVLASEYPVVTVVGPEYVTGSSRMKSGTAQKMVLNMISTALMIRMGRVRGNKMVDMQLSNRKLIDRGARMIVEETGVEYDEAVQLLLLHGSARKAIEALG